MKRRHLSIWEMRQNQRRDYGWAAATVLWVLSLAVVACFGAAVIGYAW